METHLSNSGAEELLQVCSFAGGKHVIIEEEEVSSNQSLGNDKTTGDGSIAIDVDI